MCLSTMTASFFNDYIFLQRLHLSSLSFLAMCFFWLCLFSKTGSFVFLCPSLLLTVSFFCLWLSSDCVFLWTVSFFLTMCFFLLCLFQRLWLCLSSECVFLQRLCLLLTVSFSWLCLSSDGVFYLTMLFFKGWIFLWTVSFFKECIVLLTVSVI